MRVFSSYYLTNMLLLLPSTASPACYCYLPPARQLLLSSTDVSTSHHQSLSPFLPACLPASPACLLLMLPPLPRCYLTCLLLLLPPPPCYHRTWLAPAGGTTCLTLPAWLSACPCLPLPACPCLPLPPACLPLPCTSWRAYLSGPDQEPVIRNYQELIRWA